MGNSAAQPLDSSSCSRWRAHRASYQHPDRAAFRPALYEVGPVDEVPARRFVEAHHYSRSWVSPRLRYGLYRGDELVGVAVLSVPMQKAVLTKPFPHLTPYYESLELGRFVLLDDVPANGESWFLARCFELARRDGIRGIVSFSDPHPRLNGTGETVFLGHLGIIYQASNAIFAGRGTPRSLIVLPDGTSLPERSAQKVRAGERGADGVIARLVTYGATPPTPETPAASYLQQALTEIGAHTMRHHGNLRYLFVLGSAREKKLVTLGIPSAPYPKTLEVA